METLNSPASSSRVSSGTSSARLSLAAPMPSASAQLAAGILGVGAYVPERILTNHDLEAIVETNDEWIRTRTGISERRIAAADETTTDLAEKAARRALEAAGVAAQDVQLVIVATSTADYPFPATASLLQDRLGCRGAAFDMSAACSGWVYGLVTASQFIATGAVQTALVVGAEVMSRVVDWSDRSTCILFGDGAGAAVLGPVASGGGVLGFDLGSDGSGGPLLTIEGDAPEVAHAPARSRGRITQNGREVYRFAVNVLGESVLRALASSGVAPAEVDLLVPHQANIRIIEAAAKRLELPMERVFVNLQKFGNTSAASIPIALAEGVEQGHIRDGDMLALAGFGGGLTWASCVLKWGR
jgi:3-oxoacyl-[acyl-carrier-protein] synthase-3